MNWIDVERLRVRKYSPTAEAIEGLLSARPLIAAAVARATAKHDRMNDGGGDCFNGCPGCAADDALAAAVDAYVTDPRRVR